MLGGAGKYDFDPPETITPVNENFAREKKRLNKKTPILPYPRFIDFEWWEKTFRAVEKQGLYFFFFRSVEFLQRTEQTDAETK